jgi:hypothetical protein
MYAPCLEMRFLATTQGQRESHKYPQENAKSTRKIKLFIGPSEERRM